MTRDFWKWISLAGGLAMAAVSGTPYLFGVFGPYLQTQLKYSPVQVNMVATLGNFGTYFNFLTGIFFDKFGVKPAGVLATAMLFGGYLCMWIAAKTGNPVLTHYLMFGTFWLLAGMGSGTLYQVGLGPNIRNFPQRHRGKITGCLASLFGLSGAIFTQLYQLLFAPSVLSLFLFLAITLGSFGLLGTLCVRYLEEIPESADRRHSHRDDDEATISESDKLLGGSSSSIVTPAHLQHKASAAAATTTGSLQAEERQQQQQQQQQQHAGLSAFGAGSRHVVAVCGHRVHYRPDDDNDFNILQMLLTLRFWLMFGTFFTVTGAGLTLINNLGSIAIALGGKEGSQDNFVIILSVCNWLGRVVFGLLSDRLAATFSRPMFLVFATGIMGLTHLYLAFANFEMLYFGVALGGFAYGASWCTVPVLTFELFGPKHWGSNFAATGLAPGLSSFCLASLLAGHIAERHITDGGTKCYGQACYQLTFFILAGICAVGCLIGLALTLQARPLYKRLLRTRAQSVVH